MNNAIKIVALVLMFLFLQVYWYGERTDRRDYRMRSCTHLVASRGSLAGPETLYESPNFWEPTLETCSDNPRI